MYSYNNPYLAAANAQAAQQQQTAGTQKYLYQPRQQAAGWPQHGAGAYMGYKQTAQTLVPQPQPAVSAPATHRHVDPYHPEAPSYGTWPSQTPAPTTATKAASSTGSAPTSSNYNPYMPSTNYPSTESPSAWAPTTSSAAPAAAKTSAYDDRNYAPKRTQKDEDDHYSRPHKVSKTVVEDDYLYSSGGRGDDRRRESESRRAPSPGVDRRRGYAEPERGRRSPPRRGQSPDDPVIPKLTREQNELLLKTLTNLQQGKVSHKEEEMVTEKYDTALYLALDDCPPEFKPIDKVLGDNGENLNYLRRACEARIELRGEGTSMARNKPLHIYIGHSTFKGMQEGEKLAASLVDVVQKEYKEWIEKRKGQKGSSSRPPMRERSPPVRHVRERTPPRRSPPRRSPPRRSPPRRRSPSPVRMAPKYAASNAAPSSRYQAPPQQAPAAALPSYTGYDQSYPAPQRQSQAAYPPTYPSTYPSRDPPRETHREPPREIPREIPREPSRELDDRNKSQWNNNPVLKTTIRVEGNTRYIEDHSGLLSLKASTRPDHDQSFSDHDESESHSRSQAYTRIRSRSRSPSPRRAPVREESRDHEVSRKRSRSRDKYSRSQSRDQHSRSRSRSPGYGNAKRARRSPSPQQRHSRLPERREARPSERIEKTLSHMRKESDRVDRRQVVDREDRRRPSSRDRTYSTEHSHREQRHPSRTHDRSYSSDKDRNYSSSKHSPEHRADFEDKYERISKQNAEIIAKQEINEKYERISKSYKELMRKIDSAKKFVGLNKESEKKVVKKVRSEKTVEKRSSTVKEKASESRDGHRDSKPSGSSKSGEPEKLKKKTITKVHKKDKERTHSPEERSRSKLAMDKSDSYGTAKKRVALVNEQSYRDRKKPIRTQFDFRESKAVGGRPLNMAIQSRNWDGLGEMVAAETRPDCKHLIWIFGDLNIYQATHIAKYHIRGPNLYLPQNIQLVWIGIPGLLLSEVGVALRCFMDTHPRMKQPDMMILHVGTEDVRDRIDAESAKEAVRKALYVIRKSIPAAKLVWSEVLLNRSTPYHLQNIAKSLKRAALRQMETMQNTGFCKNASFHLRVDFFRPKMMYLNNAMDLMQRFKLYIQDTLGVSQYHDDGWHRDAQVMEKSRHGELRSERSRNESEKSRHGATVSEKSSRKGSEVEKVAKGASEVENGTKGASEGVKSSEGDSNVEKGSDSLLEIANDSKGTPEAEKGSKGALETDKSTVVPTGPEKETNAGTKSVQDTKEVKEQVSKGASELEKGTEGPSATDKGISDASASEPGKSDNKVSESEKANSDVSEVQKTSQGEPVKGLFQPKTKHGMWNPVPWPQMESETEPKTVGPSMIWPHTVTSGAELGTEATMMPAPPISIAASHTETKKTTAPGPQKSTGTCDSGSKTSQLNQSVAQCLRSLSETEEKEKVIVENVDSVISVRQIGALVADYGLDASPPVTVDVKVESEETKDQNRLLVADYTSDPEESMVEEGTKPNPEVKTEPEVEKMEVDPAPYGESEEFVAKWLSDVESDLKSEVKDGTAIVETAKIKSEAESKTAASLHGAAEAVVKKDEAVTEVKKEVAGLEVKKEKADLEEAKTTDEPVSQTDKSGEDKIPEPVIKSETSTDHDAISQSTSESTEKEQVKKGEPETSASKLDGEPEGNDTVSEQQIKMEVEPEGDAGEKADIVVSTPLPESASKEEASNMEVGNTANKTEAVVKPQVSKSDVTETVSGAKEKESAMEVDVAQPMTESNVGEAGKKPEAVSNDNEVESSTTQVQETSESKEQEPNSAELNVEYHFLGEIELNVDVSVGKDVVNDVPETGVLSEPKVVETSSEDVIAIKEDLPSEAGNLVTSKLPSEPIGDNSQQVSTSDSLQDVEPMDTAGAGKSEEAAKPLQTGKSEEISKSETEGASSETKEPLVETKASIPEADPKGDSATTKELVLETTSEPVSNDEDSKPQSSSKPEQTDEEVVSAVGQQLDAKPTADSTEAAAAEAASQSVTPTAPEQNVDSTSDVTVNSEKSGIVSDDAQIPKYVEGSEKILDSKDGEAGKTQEKDNAQAVTESAAESKGSTDGAL